MGLVARGETPRRRIDHLNAAAPPLSLLTAWQFMIDLGHDAPNPLQPHKHRPMPLDGRTVLVNGAAGGEYESASIRIFSFGR